jgi:arsenate reductase
MKTVIYHNPRCSKSREALTLLNDKNLEVEVIEYLKDKPTVKQLKELINLLGIKPIQLIRTKEDVFKPYKNKQLTEDEYITLMTEFPILIERPIVVKGKKAVIGRPPQMVLDIL